MGFDQTVSTQAEDGPRPVRARDLDGVRTARVLSFFIDYVIIGVMCLPVALIIGLLGIITLGAGWALYPFLPAVVALLYLGITMGGEKQSTLGMRMMGVKLFRLDQKPVDPILAALHGILFWVINFTVFMLLISFFSSRKRLAQDILLGTYVARDSHVAG